MIEHIEIAPERLSLLENNPRTLSKEAFARLKKSISSPQGKELFKKRPCLVNRRLSKNGWPDEADGRLIVYGGNQRFRAAVDLGFALIPCIVSEMSEEQEREEKIKDNIVVGDWDFDLLANEFEIEELTDFGFDPKDLDFTDAAAEDDVPEPPTEARAKRGQVFTLGKHRLMCGDSTDAGDVALLMDGKKADMVFTDPPYGIAVVGKTGKIGGSVLAKNKEYREVIGDDRPFDPRFLIPLADIVFIWGANYFCDKLPLGQWIVWDKGRPEGTTFSDCELAWTNGTGTRIKAYRVVWNGMTRQGESGERVHPTQKPLQLCNEILKDFTKNEGTVIDLFLGSGSTLISCEQNNRACFGMEIDPKYVDVIIKRFCALTGANEEDIYSTAV